MIFPFLTLHTRRCFPFMNVRENQSCHGFFQRPTLTRPLRFRREPSTMRYLCFPMT